MRRVARPTQPAQKTVGAPIDEYKEAGTNWRYWGEVRFKQFGVHAGLTVALAAILVPRATGLGSCTLALVGIISTGAIYLTDRRATAYRREYMKRALDLEDILEFRQYHDSELHGPSSDAGFSSILATIAAAWLAYGLYYCEVANGSIYIAFLVAFSLNALVLFIVVLLRLCDAGKYLWKHGWRSVFVRPARLAQTLPRPIEAMPREADCDGSAEQCEKT